MTVPTLAFDDASDAEDAGEWMWDDDLYDLGQQQADYERDRLEAARRLQESACELLSQAATQSDCTERDRLIEQAQQSMRLAKDPLPQKRQLLERREEIVVRTCGRPAVLVRPSLPGHREVYHAGPECGLISGEGRHLTRSGWTPVGFAEAAGYRPCGRCAVKV